MELINRYVYAVVKQLPEADRKEVEKELQSLIYEMIEEYGEKIELEEAAKKVIEQLGDPALLANKYRGTERYLIGPRYFNKYILVLKIVMFGVLIGITISSFMGGIINQEQVVTMITNYISNLLFTALQGAAWVTIVFALFEYYNVNLDKEVDWSIKDLPEIPHKKALISRGESVFTIIFSTIFFSVLYFAPQLFSASYAVGSTHGKISVFNIDMLNQYEGIIALIFIVTLLQESLKILWGKWNGKRAIINAFVSLVSASLTIMFFMNLNIWNVELTPLINQFVVFDISWITNGIVGIIILATLLEIGSSLYKGFKYGN